MNWDLESERALWRDICSPTSDNPHSFYWFVQIAMGVSFYMKDQPHDNWFTEEFHKPVCDWVERHVREWYTSRKAGKKFRKKLALLMPRFTGKSFIATKSSTLYLGLLDPDLAIFIGSEIAKKASGWLNSVKEVLTGTDGYSWFTWLYGNWEDKDRKWTNSEVVHAWRKNLSKTEPSYGIWGIETGITGMHPDAGWLDDPLSEDKIKESGTWIATVNSAVGSLRPAFRTDSFLGIAFTRKRDDDVAGTFFKKEGIASWTGHPCPDSRFEDYISPKGEWDVYFMQARHPDSGLSVHPLWTTDALDQYEDSNAFEFASEMMNSPGTGEHMALTAAHIENLWIRDDELPRQLTYTIHFDTAFKNPKNMARGDESVMEVWGHDPRGNGDVYYIEGYGSNKWNHDHFTEEFIKILQRYKKEGKRIFCITDELETGGKAGLWEAHLINSAHDAGLRLPRMVTMKRGNRQKTRRIIEAASFWADGHVKLVENAPGVKHLVSQMIRIGVSKHDDWSDAASDVFATEVYRPMLLRRGGDSSTMPVRPGDEILKSGIPPRNADELRNFYDHDDPEIIETSGSDLW